MIQHLRINNRILLRQRRTEALRIPSHGGALMAPRVSRRLSPLGAPAIPAHGSAPLKFDSPLKERTKIKIERVLGYVLIL
jgi:hypothetical protein